MAKKSEINEQYVYQLISKNVKRFRALHNISQLNLSLKTGLTHNFINDIENCKKGVSAKTLAKLAIAFNIEPYQLFLPNAINNNNEMMIYVKDFNDNLQKMVSDYTQQYIHNEKG
jgi:transcriptional regulator with XRE-family HTH domain